MKQNNTIWNILLASACCILLYACTGGQEELERLNAAPQGTDSRTAEPVTADITLTGAGTLDAQLSAKLGKDKPNVQVLSISGPFNATDVECLHTLTALQSLDMTGVTVTYNNEHSNYSFTYSYVHPDGYTVKGNVNQRLSENTIDRNMFAGMTSLKEFKIPATINRIEEDAFKGCTSLEAISIPGNVESIRTGAFKDSGLTTLTFEEGITSISHLGQCSRLKTVNLPSTLKEIKDHAFSMCPSLESITIPDGVAKIDSYAFSGCAQLKTVNLPSTLKEIGSNVFMGCTRLKTVNLPSTLKEIGPDAFTGCSSLESITIPDGAAKIGSSAFRGCTRLKTANLPSTLKEIESGVFSGCSSLESITIPDGVAKIGSSTFYECTRLKTVNLPSTLKEIESDVFIFCSSLESITIPDSIAQIGSSAFRGTKLTSIRLPDALKEIDSYAFENTPLTTIEIPASCTRLGYGVFNYCKQFRTLTIPKTVSQIDGSPVDGCENLQMLRWNTTTAVPGSRPNENCFLYIYSDNGTAATYDANSWPNTIVDGIAESIRLTHSTGDWGTPMKFFCPIAFTAKSISLTMEFDEYRRTIEGKASGWRTLTLPFKVSSITSEQKGALAPFGSDVESAKPFWLRSLTPTGFQDVTSIEADKPYIIAMPNNPDVYLDEYNIWGKVTFTGENVEIAATPDELPADEGPDYLLQPTYQFVKRGGTVYALNYNYDIRNHEWGSVFARSTTHVYAYEAYVKDKSGSATRALYEIDTRSPKTRSATQKNTTGIPAIGDM